MEIKTQRPSDPVTTADSTQTLDLAVKELSALAHTGRLTLFCHLIQAGSAGVTAGDLARFADIGPTTASAQLTVLANANLVKFQRQGRRVIYTANYGEMRQLMRFLLHDCCASNPSICEAILTA